MAPAQCPRQVLIWTIPAIAVLISFFWYKRRKTSLRSDPGGTTQQKSLELVDSNGSLKTNTVTSVDSNKVIAAIEKAIRDRETSQAIEEVVSVEEEEEIEVIDKAVVKENNGNVLALAEINVDDNKESVVTKTDITDLDSSIISISDTTINSSTSDNDNTIIISSTETSFVGEDVIVKTTVDLSESTKSEDQNAETDDNSPFVILDKKTELDVKESNENCGDKKVITAKNIATVESPLNSNKGNKVTNSNKKRSNKKSNKENSVICNNNNNNKTTEVKIKKQDEKIKDKKQLINGGTEISHKEEKSKNKSDESPSAIIGNSDKVVVNESNKKMELSCSRVDHVGHNPSSTIVNGNEAGLEQKLATLGLESSHNHNSEGSGERDSANHSPAEVMLASPSMSTFSDAHSEGSSDSGKGCSDIPDISTPPPQTPAGGSSVSGDLVPSVYEFIIPQYMVGRLIGRHGVFLHDIRSKTHTHIFIKRHPDTTKLKICAIEGAQQDIDAALAMIRQKFPLRRFPNLTLEKVTFVNIMPSLCPLQQEQFQLQLIEGVNNDVILSSLISAGHFFLQQPMHPSYQSLSQLNLVMNTVYSSPEAPALDTPLKDAICAAPAMGGWYRAQIIDVDEDNKTVDVRFLDYGGFLTLETSALRKIRGDLMLLPFQAVECLLANVIPAGGEDAEWTEEARLFVQNLTCGQILQANISEYTEQGIPLVFLYAMYCGQVVVVNQELVARGYAEACTPAISEE